MFDYNTTRGTLSSAVHSTGSAIELSLSIEGVWCSDGDTEVNRTTGERQRTLDDAGKIVVNKFQRGEDTGEKK